ncbi:MAG TPA: zinc-ribbon domain-containing protein, partial [Rhodocyclaceae bacterium]|nr:zinc-ribbon domain-containing protein [Rhodocyclaceae bacterium]
MRTRCPQCATSFRITPEQLRAKAGKVRCGHCQAVFDAFDSLIDDTGPVTVMPLPPAAKPKKTKAPVAE